MGKSKVKRGKGGKVIKKPTKKQLEGEAAKAEAAQTEQKVATSGAESELEAGIVCTFGESARGVAANMRDIKVDQLSISFHGHKLVQDCQLNLNFGRRYGLLGANGSGKSTLMKAIAYRMVPIPENIDIFFLDGEYAATDKTALQAVLDVDAERAKLEKEADELSQKMGEGGDEEQLASELEDIYNRLDAMDVSTAETRAASLLHGLGFTPEMQQKKTREFSGGWRMRISLARALFIGPTLMLLDEPTNHLDMEAVVWLEEYLKNFNRILLLVSHSQDFLNNVCTNIVFMKDQQLTNFGGNYDTYMQTRRELEGEQTKRYMFEQEQIAHMKEYIARFGHGSAKLARQAQSKEKTLQKMIDAGLTKPVQQDTTLAFKFIDPPRIPPPVLMFQDVAFRYNNELPYLYENVSFGVDMDSRVALVGPNGAGKTTLLKLMMGKLQPSEGMVRPHVHLKISQYAQHTCEELPMDVDSLTYMLNEYPDFKGGLPSMRSWLGRYGITGALQIQNIGHMSDGQRSRLVFAWMALQNPHILFFDEPTNHLDMESIDSLAEAIKNFQGGMVLVSHDMRLIDQVANQIWEVKDLAVTVFPGDISSYKVELKRRMAML